MKVPGQLRHLAHQEGGRAWLETLPGLAAQVSNAWSLRILGRPFPDSSVSLVLPAELPDGRGVVLKLQFPHTESEHEAAALKRWAGDGAVQLIDHDSVRNALLIERCSPGVHLSTQVPDDAVGVLIGLLPRLWKPAGNHSHPFAKRQTDGNTI